MLQQSKSMWGRSRNSTLPVKQLTSIVDGLKRVYFSKVHWGYYDLRPTGFKRPPGFEASKV